MTTKDFPGWTRSSARVTPGGPSEEEHIKWISVSPMIDEDRNRTTANFSCRVPRASLAARETARPSLHLHCVPPRRRGRLQAGLMSFGRHAFSRLVTEGTLRAV